MKKVLIFGLAALMSLSLAACGGKSKKEAEASPAASAAVDVADAPAANADVPEEYKEWIIDGTSTVESKEVNGQSGVAFVTDKSKEDVIKFFTDKATAVGATETTVQDTDQAWMYLGTLKDGQAVVLIVAAAEGQTVGSIAISAAQ